jgi:hypothetical protein
MENAIIVDTRQQSNVWRPRAIFSNSSVGRLRAGERDGFSGSFQCCLLSTAPHQPPTSK